MKIFVIGAGFTGTQLARELIAERNEVVLIDNDPENVRHAGDQLDCTVLEADGNNLETLERAGIARADACVTTTGDDEVNMITCSLVDAVYPEIKKIARVRNYAYYTAADTARRRVKTAHPDARPLYGIDTMLNPDVEASTAIASAMEHGAVGDVIELDGGYGIATLSVGEGSPLAGLSLRRLATLEGWNFLVAFVESNGELALPVGDTVLNQGDRIGVVTPLSGVSTVVSFTKSQKGELNRVVLFGADRVGSLLLARRARKRSSNWLKQLGVPSVSRDAEFLVVDRDAARCREIVEKHPDVRTFCGDVTDENLLNEEDLFGCDLLVAASGNHELNLVTAAYMKSRGVGKAIALTANSSYGEIARKLGVDVAVPMRGTVVDAVMGHLRGRHVQSVHSVCNRRFEIIEGDVAPKSDAAGRKLSELMEKCGGEALVLLHRARGGGVCEVPRGGTVLRPGERVVVIVRGRDAKAAGRFFGGE
ncbi:MAG: NAD-binding protein [Kiritimatiellae bacterium]|nr:NAD-binding protein [Kiritimatiellia bacterium]